VRGHIRKRGSTYSIVYDERPRSHPDGRKVRERGGFRTRREAEDALTQALSTLGTGGYVQPARLRLGEFLDRLARGEGRQRPQAHHRRLLPLQGGPLHQAKARAASAPAPRRADHRGALREVHREGGRGGKALSLRTVSYCRTILRAALDDAVRLGLLASNPARAARIPATAAGRLAASLGARAAVVCGRASQVPRCRVQGPAPALWLTYATTGLRRGEALACGGRRWTSRPARWRSGGTGRSHRPAAPARSTTTRLPRRQRHAGRSTSTPAPSRRCGHTEPTN
jgi:integrase